MNDVNRPSLHEAARRGAEANRQTKPAAPPPKPTRARPAEAVKATASCGHEIDVGPCKPAFLAERQKKLAANPCPECKRKAQEARIGDGTGGGAEEAGRKGGSDAKAQAMNCAAS